VPGQVEVDDGENDHLEDDDQESRVQNGRQHSAGSRHQPGRLRAGVDQLEGTAWKR